VIAGICPNSTIVVYFAEWTEQGWITAMDAVVQDKTLDPGVIPVSWGALEDTDIWTDQAMTQINESFQEPPFAGSRSASQR
jgi:kumamolisin